MDGSKFKDLIDAATVADDQATERRLAAKDADTDANRAETRARSAWNEVFKALMELKQQGAVGFRGSDLDALLALVPKTGGVPRHIGESVR